MDIKIDKIDSIDISTLPKGCIFILSSGRAYIPIEITSLVSSLVKNKYTLCMALKEPNIITNVVNNCHVVKVYYSPMIEIIESESK